MEFSFVRFLEYEFLTNSQYKLQLWNQGKKVKQYEIAKVWSEIHYFEKSVLRQKSFSQYQRFPYQEKRCPHCLVTRVFHLEAENTFIKFDLLPESYYKILLQN